MRVPDEGAQVDRYELLAAARKELGEIHDERERAAYDLGRSALSDKAVQAYRHGRAAEACERADDAIFNVLNVLTNFCDDERAKAVLHA
jgi:hypothetical protein